MVYIIYIYIHHPIPSSCIVWSFDLRYMSKLQSAMPKPNISKHLLGHRQDPLRSEKEEETQPR